MLDAVQMQGRHQVQVDRSRDRLLTDFGRATLDDRYLMPGESYQDLFARVASYYGDDAAHAQRIYDYASRMWFMPATPVLSNGGTTRGLPISCLTGDMLINVRGGLKPIRDVEAGDEVLTHRGRWRRVVAKASRDADDLYEMVVDRRRTKIRITGNHPVLTDAGWVRVDGLDPRRHRVAINRTLAHEAREHSIDLALHCPYEAEVREEELVAISTGRRLDKRPGHGTRSYYATPRARVAVDEEMAWALGLWFAEGSITRTPRGTPNGVRITVGHDEGALAERWADIMRRRFGVHAMAYASEVERRGRPNRWISVNANSTALGAYFACEFGERATDKAVPTWLLDLPHNRLRAFLDAFAAGDGCEHDAGTGGRFRYTTIGINNPALMGGLYNIALLLGLDLSLKLDKTAGKLASRPTYQEMTLHPDGYHLRYAPKRRDGEAVQYVKLSSLRRLRETETVYDIQVEEDESFSVAGVVVHNCFLNEATDSLDGIVGLWNENVWLASKGGGIGSYWGNLRSIGEKVGQNGKTSGVIPFIRVMDSLTLAISQGSLRRGSAAVYLPISHPEVEEFVELRRPTGGDPNRKALNLHHGVLVSDAFMRAVEADEQWALCSPKDGAMVRLVSARALWIRILTARIETGEPYLVFSDHVNSARPEQQKLSGLEIKTSNLCLAGDARIATDTGIRTLGELFESQEEFAVVSDLRTLKGARVASVRAPNGQMRNSASYGTGMFPSSRVVRTGIDAEILKVTTKSGRVLRGTADHAVMTARGWLRIGELAQGDRVLIQSAEGAWNIHRALPAWTLRERGKAWTARYARKPLSLPTEWSLDLGVVLGCLVGDGYIATGTGWPALVFGTKEEELIPRFRAVLEAWFPGAIGLHTSANCPHLVVRDSRAGEFFGALGVTTAKAHEKRVPASLWTAPRDAVIGFLRGIFSTDGTVNRTKDGCTVRLGSTSRVLLGEVQVLLSNLGIVGTIYERRAEGTSLLPTSQREVAKPYATKPVWELVIGKENRNRFAAEIGFLNGFKQDNVVDFIARQTARGAYSESFEDEVVSIERDGREDVYDITVDESHSFIANGIAVHNCSEITLPTGIDHHGRQRTAVCCLASLNLESWLEWHDHPLFIEDVMRFLDNVLQDFIDRAPEGMERARYSAMRERSVGLGVMGFHSFLQSQSVPFESVIAKVWNKRMFKHIRAQADAASRMLAEERGPCPDAEEYGIMERFSNKMAIAPTASISVIAGNTSPGIEPIAANVFLQKTLSGSFTVRNRHLQQLLATKGMDTDAIWSSITINKGSVQHLDFLTEGEKAVYRTAFELDQRWVVEHAADRTPFICQSQSVNLFLPASVHKRDLHQIHYLAWKRGVKSLYYCRSLSIQRADNVSEKVVRPAEMATAATPVEAGQADALKTTNYEECLACQ